MSDLQNLVAEYLVEHFSDRSLEIYWEFSIGRSIAGKNRTVDLLVRDPTENLALGLECKQQTTSGTADEKIPYALDDLKAMNFPGGLVYGGRGFSEGIMHMLRCSPLAMEFNLNSPKESQEELNQFVAVQFGWWDVLTARLEPFRETKP